MGKTLYNSFYLLKFSIILLILHQHIGFIHNSLCITFYLDKLLVSIHNLIMCHKMNFVPSILHTVTKKEITQLFQPQIDFLLMCYNKHIFHINHDNF